MAANVAVAQDPAGNLKPAKDKSTERIDGIVAAIMAIGRAMVAQEEASLRRLPRSGSKGQTAPQNPTPKPDRPKARPSRGCLRFGSSSRMPPWHAWRLLQVGRC
jgi:phage terminase large subunit-like protein